MIDFTEDVTKIITSIKKIKKRMNLFQKKYFNFDNLFYLVVICHHFIFFFHLVHLSFKKYTRIFIIFLFSYLGLFKKIICIKIRRYDKSCKVIFMGFFKDEGV